MHLGRSSPKNSLANGSYKMPDVANTQNNDSAITQEINKEIKSDDIRIFLKKSDGIDFFICETPEDPHGKPSDFLQGHRVFSDYNFVTVNNQKDSNLDKLIVTFPSALISLSALIISFMALKHTRKEHEKSRTRSIEDDFLIRKIVSPSTIELLIKYSSDLAASLPDINSNLSEQEAEDLWVSKAMELEQITVSFYLFTSICDELYKNIQIDLDKISDDLAEHFGKILMHINNPAGNPPRNSELSTKVSKSVVRIIMKLKNYQFSITIQDNEISKKNKARRAIKFFLISIARRIK